MLRTTIYATLIVILTTATVSAQTDKQGLSGYTNSVRTDLEKKNDVTHRQEPPFRWRNRGLAYRQPSGLTSL